MSVNSDKSFLKKIWRRELSFLIWQITPEGTWPFFSKEKRRERKVFHENKCMMWEQMYEWSSRPEWSSVHRSTRQPCAQWRQRCLHCRWTQWGMNGARHMQPHTPTHEHLLTARCTRPMRRARCVCLASTLATDPAIHTRCAGLPFDRFKWKYYISLLKADYLLTTIVDKVKGNSEQLFSKCSVSDYIL